MSYGSVFPSPTWAEVWIVARGPSAARFDLTRLRAKQVLGVNTFVLCCEIPAAVCSADWRWIHSNRDLLSRFQGERCLAVSLETHPECDGIPGATYLERRRAEGLSEDPGALSLGGSSGYAAINLAYLKGAKTIHLVGYDMDPAYPGTNAHDREKFREWAPLFRSMLPQLKAAGVEVLNHNPASQIDAFPFAL